MTHTVLCKIIMSIHTAYVKILTNKMKIHLSLQMYANYSEHTNAIKNIYK